MNLSVSYPINIYPQHLTMDGRCDLNGSRMESKCKENQYGENQQKGTKGDSL